jgi:hypothetical protein
MNEWTSYVNNRDCIDVVYIDLEKAFDTVSHVKLLVKLRSLGVGGSLHVWLTNYLSYRRQYVRVGSSLSSMEAVMSGIPQGTILGPLLFILYINDLTNEINSSAISLYADDSKIYLKSNHLADCLNLADDLLNIQAWFDDWQLRINVNKCEVLHIGASNIEFPYRLSNFVLPDRNSIKDLGFHVSKNLSLSNHCNIVCRNAFYRQRQFFRAFACKDRSFLLFFFCTYIRPLIESNMEPLLYMRYR